MKVTKEVRFEAAHRLMGYDGPCSNLHGHSYVVQATWSSDDLNDVGMVRDFKRCKKDLEMILNEWDHKVILQEYDPLIPILRAAGQTISVVTSPPTAENMAATIKDAINCSEVKVWETSTSYATA